MSLFCIQCAMRDMLDGNPAKQLGTFEETAEEHLARVHPDPVAAKQERLELERRLIESGFPMLPGSSEPPPSLSDTPT